MNDTKTNTLIHLPKCGIDVTINEIKVDDKDDALLNIEYDFNEKTEVKKEDIDDEISEIILSALEDAVKDRK